MGIPWAQLMLDVVSVMQSTKLGLEYIQSRLFLMEKNDQQISLHLHTYLGRYEYFRHNRR